MIAIALNQVNIGKLGEKLMSGLQINNGIQLFFVKRENENRTPKNGIN